jgi:hypothetical protein
LEALPKFNVWVTVQTTVRVAVPTGIGRDDNCKSFVQSRAAVSSCERGGRCVVNEG